MKKYVIIFFLGISISAFSQNKFGIKEISPSEMQQKCQECMSVINTLPPEVSYGFLPDGKDIYFVMTDQKYFDLLFKKPMDGIAVDVITKTQFPCGADNKFANSSYNMGELLKPIYYKEFKKNIIVDNGQVAVKVASLPAKYVGTEYELNILILKNNNPCHYSNFYDLPQTRWGLLDMGLYQDTISKEEEQKEQMFSDKNTKTLNKTLKFVIPFEKGKSEYLQEDIKPIYDSLSLTDYNISKISIKAYSSVEGTLEDNIKLQNKRAQSIVDGIQSFQKQEIEISISSSENWVEFLVDAKNAGYNGIANASKQEIKEELNNKGLAKKMEPFLKNHRKAIIVMVLEKKTKFINESNSLIQSYYKEAIENKTIDRAVELQLEIYARIRTKKMPKENFEKIEIPKQIEYGTLLKNEAAFNFEQNEDDLYAALLAFKELEVLLPDDYQIKYNISVIQLKSWVYGELLIEPDQLLKDIKSLSSKGLDNKMVKRLLINYHIINSEYMMFKRDYKAKDVSISYIYKNYKYINMSDNDYLQLSKYFSSYAKYEWAEKILKPHIKNIDVDEELLFYYLNLTIIDPKNTRNATYRTIMLNAINLNKERYCKLYDPYGTGGINFQLLNDKYLKSTYCENCN